MAMASSSQCQSSPEGWRVRFSGSSTLRDLNLKFVGPKGDSSPIKIIIYGEVVISWGPYFIYPDSEMLSLPEASTPWKPMNLRFSFAFPTGSRESMAQKSEIHRSLQQVPWPKAFPCFAAWSSQWCDLSVFQAGMEIVQQMEGFSMEELME